MDTLRAGRVARFWTSVVCAALTAGVVGCQTADFARSSNPPADPSTVYTPAHRTFGSAVNDFFWVRSRPVQPIEFPHKAHVAKGLTCTEFCHDSATTGPIAGLPSVTTCMVCHASIAADRPLIKKIAAWADQGLDLQWQRVYRYTDQAHVKFNHAPHIRAHVECAACHGDVANQTVARRNVDLHMGFCVSCHRERKAPDECVTCHF